MIHAARISIFCLATGIQSFDLDLPAKATLQAVHQVVKRYSALQPHRFCQTCDLPLGLNTVLKPGDPLKFSAPVAGG
jgi:hypothetical protein